MSFALPITSALCLIVCALVTLLHYLRHGKLYVIGGFFILLGAWIALIELLLDLTFSLDFIGWSFYPLAVLFLVGALLIYLAINRSARAAFERKLFF